MLWFALSLLITLMIIFLSPLSLPTDIQQQTIYTIVSKPVSRLEMIWGRASLIVFAVAFSPIPGVDDTLTQILHPDNWGFLTTYVAVGGVFAGLIFGISVIAIPMILDRQVDAVSAGLTSLRFPRYS